MEVHTMLNFIPALFAAMPDFMLAMFENLRFDPMQFIYNLKYLAIGLIGIFIVIGIIMLVTVILNKLPSGGKDKDDAQN